MVPFTFYAGLLIIRAVADPRNSGISAKSREIPKKTRNTAISSSGNVLVICPRSFRLGSLFRIHQQSPQQFFHTRNASLWLIQLADKIVNYSNGVEASNVINDPKCNKGSNNIICVIGFSPKCDGSLNSILQVCSITAPNLIKSLTETFDGLMRY